MLRTFYTNIEAGMKKKGKSETIYSSTIEFVASTAKHFPAVGPYNTALSVFIFDKNGQLRF